MEFDDVHSVERVGVLNVKRHIFRGIRGACVLPATKTRAWSQRLSDWIMFQ